MIGARTARVIVFLLVTWLALVAAAHAETWQAKVTNISDGDTITVIGPAGKQERIRFYGIDAPESGQPFGRASTNHVKDVIGSAGFQVEITAIDQDRYGRIVGMVIVNGLNLNRDLVKNPVKYGIWVCWPEREEYVTGRIQSMGKPLPA